MGDFFSSRADPGLHPDLDPDFAERMQRAASAAEAATGERVRFTSLRRMREKQAELYQAYLEGRNGPAARPGTSLHERGLAADLAPGAAREWIRRHAGEYGIQDLGAKDVEHFQIAGYASPRRGVNASQGVPSAAQRRTGNAHSGAQASHGRGAFGFATPPGFIKIPFVVVPRA